MKARRLIQVVTLGLVAALALAAAPADAAKLNNRFIALQVQVSKVGGGSIGTFSIKPSQPIPVKAGGTYHLAMVGTEVVNGKIVKGVPVEATFTNASGARLELSNPGSNSTDVKVISVGKGLQIKFATGPGVSIRKSWAKGKIFLHKA